MPGLRRFGALAAYVGVLLLAGVLALVAAEWYLSRRAARAQIPFYNKLYPYVMFRPHESAEYVTPEPMKMSHFKTRAYHYTNEDGFRVPRMGYRIAKPKPSAQLRVAVLGSSAVQLASTYETSLPGALKSHLQSLYPG